MPILDLSAPYQALPNRGHSFIERAQAQTATLNGGADALNVGSNYAGGVIIAIDPQQGYRVRMPDGKERYVPANINPKLEPFLKDDGTLDVVSAVKGGVTDPIDYAGWNVTQDTIESVKTYNKAQAATERLKSYIGESGTLDLSAAVKAGYTSTDDYTGWNVTAENIETAKTYNNQVATREKLKPYLGEDSSLDLAAAVKAGYVSPDDYNGWSVSQEDIESAKLVNKSKALIERLSPYKTDSGYDIYKAIKGDVAKTDLIDAFGMTDAEYSNYTLTAPFVEYGTDGKASVNLQLALDTLNGKTKATSTKASPKGSVDNLKAYLTDKGGATQPATAAASVDPNELIAAIQTQFGVTFYNQGGILAIKSSETRQSEPMTYTPKDLPDGIDQAQIATMQTQLDDINKQIAELTAGNNVLRAGEADNAQFTYLSEQAASLSNAISALNGYTSGDPAYNEVPTALTADNIKDIIAYTDPSLKKYMTIDSNYTGTSGTAVSAFDIVGARDDGVDDKKLLAIGFTADDITLADAYVKLDKILPDGIKTYADIAAAQDAGLTAELVTIGIPDDELKIAAANAKITKLLPDGITTFTAIQTAKQAGITDAELNTIGITDADIQYSDSLQRLIDKGFVNAAGEIDFYSAQNAGLDADLLTVGYTQTELKEARLYNKDTAEWYAAHTEIDGQWFANTDLASLKENNPALYTTLTERGFKAYQDLTDPMRKGGHEITAVEDALQPYNNDINAYLRDVEPATGIKVLQEAGYTNEQINDAVTYNAIQTELEPYKQGDGYKLDKFIQDHPEDGVKKLIQYGYSNEAISEAIESVKISNIGTTVDDFGKIINSKPSVLDWNGQRALSRAQHAMNFIGGDIAKKYEKQWRAGASYTEIWSMMSDAERKQIADKYAKGDVGLIIQMAETLPNALSNKVEQISKSDSALIKNIGNALTMSVMSLGVASSLRAKLSDDKKKNYDATLKSANTQTTEFIENIDKWSKKFPDPISRFDAGFISAMAGILGGVANGSITTIQASNSIADKQYGQGVSNLLNVAGGAVLFPLSLPRRIAEDPASGVGYTIGMLVGVHGALKIIKKVGGKALTIVDPYAIIDRVIGIEYAAGKIDPLKFNETAVMEGVGEAIREVMSKKGDVRVPVKGSGGAEIRARSTPIEDVHGGILFHGTPDATPVMKLKNNDTFIVGKGDLYTDPYAPNRFVARSADGTLAKRPAFYMVLTTPERIKTFAKGRAELSSPTKTYQGNIETEIVAREGRVLTRLTNLRSRLLGGKAGEFYTQYSGVDTAKLKSGDFIPIYVLADKGAKIKMPTPKELYAAKLLVIRETLKDFKEAASHPLRTAKDLTSGRMGVIGVREVELVTDALNKALKDRKGAAVDITRAVSKIDTPPVRSISLGQIEGIPKASVGELTAWLNKQRNYRAYGSIVDYAHLPDAVAPKDLDLAIKNASKAANEIADIVRRTTGKKVTVKVSDPSKGGHGANIYLEDGGKSIEVADIRELGDHIKEKFSKGLKVSKQTVIVDGIVMERLGDQAVMRCDALIQSGLLEGEIDPLKMKNVARFKAEVAYLMTKGLLDLKTRMELMDKIAEFMGEKYKYKPVAKAAIAANLYPRLYEKGYIELGLYQDAIKKGFIALANSALKGVGKTFEEKYETDPEFRRQFEAAYSERLALAMQTLSARQSPAREAAYREAIKRTLENYRDPIANLQTRALQATSNESELSLSGNDPLSPEIREETPIEQRIEPSLRKRPEPDEIERPREPTERKPPKSQMEQRIEPTPLRRTETDLTERRTPPPPDKPTPLPPERRPPPTQPKRRPPPPPERRKPPPPPTYKPPPPPPEIRPPPNKTPNSPRVGKMSKDSKKRKKGIGIYTWRQGAFWTRRIFRPESEGGVLRLWQRKPFEDAPVKKRLPDETFYVGGKDGIPENYKEQMGAVNVKISPTGYPILRYRGKGKRL